MNQTIPSATLSEVRYAISRLKSNKAADYLALKSEHLRYGGLCVETYLLNLVNYIFATKRVPAALKSGMIIPIYKKGEKTDPANYRGITMTSVLLKITEHIHNKRHNNILEKSQSQLQKGFTPARHR